MPTALQGMRALAFEPSPCDAPTHPTPQSQLRKPHEVRYLHHPEKSEEKKEIIQCQHW